MYLLRKAFESDLPKEIVYRKKSPFPKTYGKDYLSLVENEIRTIVLEVLSENSNLVDDYKAGKRVFDFIVGQIMKKTRGRANPVITSRILKEELDK